jgi:flagellar hook-associated protein 3 FlgL
MVSLTPYTMHNLKNLNNESVRIAHQMSTGRLIDNGSDDSSRYTEILNIEDRLRVYQNIQVQVENTVAQNRVADTALTQIKEQVDTVKKEVMKALHSGMDSSTKQAMAVNIDGIKTTLLMLANTEVNGEYVFTGSDTTIKPFVEDTTTKQVKYEGDGILRRIAIDPGVYREKSVSGFDVMMYNRAYASEGETLEFAPTDRIIDEEGHEWTFLRDHNEIVDYTRLYRDGNPDGESIKVWVPIQDAPYMFKTDMVEGDGRILYAKKNYFDDLDNIINALQGYDKDGATLIDNETVTKILKESLDNTGSAYDAVNVAHAKLGGRDKIFINASERISSLIKHFDILLNKTDAADLSKVAMESQSLELLYTSLYSTISKLDNLSLINFVK